MGNEMKKFRQISTKAHRTGCRRKKQEKTIRHAWARKNRAVLRGSALLRANSSKRRCNTSLSHAKQRLATRRHLCCLALHWLSSGRNPVEKGKKQVQVPIFAGFEQKDVMTRLPYRRDP